MSSTSLLCANKFMPMQVSMQHSTYSLKKLNMLSLIATKRRRLFYDHAHIKQCYQFSWQVKNRMGINLPPFLRGIACSAKRLLAIVILSVCPSIHHNLVANHAQMRSSTRDSCYYWLSFQGYQHWWPLKSKNSGFSVILFLHFQVATHISRVNCAEITLNCCCHAFQMSCLSTHKLSTSCIYMHICNNKFSALNTEFISKHSI